MLVVWTSALGRIALAPAGTIWQIAPPPQANRDGSFVRAIAKRPKAVKALMTLIRPIKFDDDKSKAPASFFSRWGFGLSRACSSRFKFCRQRLAPVYPT